MFTRAAVPVALAVLAVLAVLVVLVVLVGLVVPAVLVVLVVPVVLAHMEGRMPCKLRLQPVKFEHFAVALTVAALLSSQEKSGEAWERVSGERPGRGPAGPGEARRGEERHERPNPAKRQ